MELKDVDLNLLVVFHQVRLERRVSRVAATLGLSQPAVSNALARLRRLFGDPLFVPTARGMEPTPFAVQLAEPVADALAAIHGAINRRSSFEPATSRRSFTIGMTDIGEIHFLPALMDELSRVAPGVSLSTALDGAAELKDEMAAGRVDLALGLLPALRAGFYQRRLFRQRYVCLFRNGHPLHKRRIGLAEFTRADHVAIVAAGTGHGTIDTLLARRGVERRVRLTVPHFGAVGHILQETDLVATVPRVYAERVAVPFGLAFVGHPAALPEFVVNLFWHARFHQDAANRWLRELVARLFADSGAPS